MSAEAARAAEPLFSLTGGLARHVPGNAPGVRSGPGIRGGVAFPASLPAGGLHIPLEWGFALRLAGLRFSDSFDEAVFTDLQVPLLFHGDAFGWKYLEPLAIWTPSYTLNMVTRRSGGGEIPGTEALRTRFNMGFGAGLQAVYHGFRLRAYGSHNIFPAFAGSDLTVTDWTLEAAAPLVWKKGAR